MQVIIKNFELDMKTFVDSYFSSEDKKELVLPVNFTFYRGNIEPSLDEERFLIIVSGLDNDSSKYIIAEYTYELPKEALKTEIGLGQRLEFPKDFIEKNDILNLKISLAITSKHDGDMGIGESIRVGTFFEATINLRNLPEEIIGE